jgi:hypothetical protein
MMSATHITVRFRLVAGLGILAMIIALTAMEARAQSSAPASEHAIATAPKDRGVVIDQVIAVVNGDLVLESDIEEERRFQAFQPFRDASLTTRAKMVERLIDRALIMQQEKLQPQPKITDAEVNTQLAALRKNIPACKEYKCETDAGWQKFVADQGFTMPELVDRWRERMNVLRFIEERFRMGIRIPQADVRSYYEEKLLPQYKERNQPPPQLRTISNEIREILLQQQVGALLEDWLKSLKAQGTVRMTRPEEATP